MVEPNVIVIVGLGFVIIGFILMTLGPMFATASGAKKNIQTPSESHDVDNNKIESKTQFAVAGFIGPIPFGFGNNNSMIQFAIIAAIVMAVIYLVIMRVAP